MTICKLKNFLAQAGERHGALLALLKEGGITKQDWDKECGSQLIYFDLKKNRNKYLLK